jgi:N-ethylmaleimide reductase
MNEREHVRGGYIFMQLWHVGRNEHSDLMNGESPVAPSIVPFSGRVYTQKGWVDPSPHRELKTEEIPVIIQQYAAAARRAKEAGFDGVELHAANGYLLDQFLEDGSNKRTDNYGGSVENRSGILFEIVEELKKIWESNRIGVRLSPSTTFNGMSDSNPEKAFSYIANKLNDYDLAYLNCKNSLRFYPHNREEKLSTLTCSSCKHAQ